MPQLTPAALRSAIDRHEPPNLLVIGGDDDHEKSALALALGEMVEDDLRAFNVERLYAGEKAVSVGTVVEAARTLPMLSPGRIVIVLQAERMLNPRKRGPEAATESDDSADLDALIDYVAAPSSTTTLAFVLSSAEGKPDDLPLNRTRKVTKALLKHATVVLCTGLDGGKDPGRWVEERAKAAGLEIDRAAVRRLLDITGSEPTRLRAEVEKLLLFASDAGRVSVEHVAALAGTPAHHNDDWALVRAVERGDARLALRELQAALDHGGIPFAILGQIGYAVRTPPPRGRFPASRVPAAIDALFRTDQAMKSSIGDPRVLLERLVVELCG
jgi:DNA polymerase III delta subunit